MPAPRVIVLGSINVDLVIHGPRLPREGETLLGGRFFQSLGGKGANQAVAAARAARDPVAFIAAAGDDAFGRAALAALAGENLVCDFIRTIADEPTGVALIMVGGRGENAICVASGANARLAPANVDAVPQSLFERAKVFLACLESPLDAVERGLARAKQAGLLTILNPAPASADAIDRGLLRWVDVLTPNETEAAQLIGGSPDAIASDAATAGRKLQALGCRAAIITLGSAGCHVCDDGGTRLPALPVRAVDTTAAGDAFNGALAVALAEGLRLMDAARFATRAAALAVTRAGAQPSLPTRAEIDAFGIGQ
jgi:ribokinase